MDMTNIKPSALGRTVLFFCAFGSLLYPQSGESASMEDYCIQPPFVSQVVPPLLMFVMDKEHRLFTEAYSDSFDLDADGKTETTYKHGIEYYGYFDPNKCYTYSTTANEFQPSNYSTQTGNDAQGKAVYDRFCSSGKWSGNVLNWLTMSRMDVLKKVLYGGQRVNPDATNKTTLQRAYIPQDAHSFGKEFTGRLCNSGTTYTTMCSRDSDCDSGYTCQDKSLQLIGIAAPPSATNCTYTSDIVSTPANGKILVATYNHSSGAAQDVEVGASHQNIMDSFVPANFVKSYYISDFNADDTSAANNDLIPTQNHGQNNSFIAVSEFNVKKKTSGNPKYNYTGTWTFHLDSDDGAELYVDGVPVASYYSVAGTSGHSSCPTSPATSCLASQTGTINLAASGYHTLLVRGTNYGGDSGAKVWYKRPGDTTWTVFGTATGAQDSLDLRSPIIPDTTANCTMMADSFIASGVPVKGVLPGYHLFCNKSTTGNNSYGPPLLRMLANRSERIWDWISREVVQCGNTLGTGTAVTPSEYQVNIQVCNSTVGLEPNCKAYGASNKPIGLLQKYGDSDGTKVCSKTLSQVCNSDSACRPDSNGGVDLGICVDKSQMYFGLLTGSYAHNLQGGVLRKNLLSISDEVDASGMFKAAQNIPSNMLETFDKLQIVGYTDATTNYANCVAQNQSIVDGKCSVWGNPMAEMLYETLRYYSGKGVPTTGFDYPQNQTDGGLNLPHPPYWGYVDGARSFKGPYDVYPSCSKPFVLLLGDVYPSFDADQLPGVTGSSYTEDTTVHPVLGLDNVVSGKKLLSKLLDDIATTESVANNSFFIGDNGTLYDFICTPKTASTMSLLRGLCPEQPTRKGSFYTAALAYYGHSFLHAEVKKDTTSGVNNNIPNTQTFAVAMASQVGNWTIKAGANTLRIVPLGKSVSGAVSMTATCFDKMNVATTNFSDGTLKTLTLTPKTGVTDAYCPTNEIVKVFTHSVKYDSSGNPIYLSFRINYADAEQGADYDMDAVGWYEVCTQAAKNAGYGTCGTDMDADQVQIKVVSDYAAGGIDQVLGFIVSGTSEDGTYLVVRDKSVNNTAPAIIYGLPFNWSHIFTVTGSSANTLKDPLWYAAKWGGFQDSNGNKVPDQKQEWAKNCTETDTNKCNPDNYYLVTNPLKLEQQLEKAFNDILTRVSSGTAASILNNSEGSGATLLQAVFYPKKTYENQTSLSWSGELMNLWYYVDPFFSLSTIREDSDYTTGNHVMDIASDKRVQFYFDDADSQTKIKRYNFDGTTEQADFNADVPGGLKTIWTAGKLLWKRDISSGADPRTIYTNVASVAPWSFTDFTTANAATLASRLNAEGADAAAQTAFAGKVISYVHGSDVCLDSSSPCTNKSRSRTVDIKVSDTALESHVWKLGDIISSTPKIQGRVPLQSYDQKPPLGYDDSTYKDFYKSAHYDNRGMVYVGANDGMLHAFKLGKMDIKTSGTQKATLSGVNLGREEWAFIPKHVMPYLKYLTQPDYDNNHLYLVDGTNSLFDISAKTVAARDDYWNETRTASTWKTVLLGGMGLGGASKNFGDTTCTAGTAAGTCVKAPLNIHGYSSYYALDVTNQDFNQDSSNLLRAQPTLLWEFSNPALGYSTSGPAIMRLNSKSSTAPFAPQSTTNGRWFAVYASGPTGPIDTTTKQFKGKSDQNLKLFVVDMEKGPVVSADPKQNGLWIIDTGISEAFAGSISNNAVVDAEMVDPKNTNLRQDDVLYVGYTRKCVSGDSGCTVGEWTTGGVLRLVVPDSANPDTMDIGAWKTSKVVDGIGPVTTTVSKLMSKNNLYLFFGTGRYYYPQDDMASTRRLLMVKEKCYPQKNTDGTYKKSDMIETCDSTNSVAASLALSDLTSKNTPSNSAVANGWYIDLDAGERVVTDTVATVNGAIFYTSYKPTADVCGFGGKSYLWGVKYDTGDALPASARKGKILIQLSTGSFAEKDLSSALTDKGGRRTPETSDLSFGKASAGPGLIMTSAGLTPVKRILHIQERYK